MNTKLTKGDWDIITKCVGYSANMMNKEKDGETSKLCYERLVGIVTKLVAINK